MLAAGRNVPKLPGHPALVHGPRSYPHQADNCRNSKNLLPAVPATFIHSVDSVTCIDLSEKITIHLLSQKCANNVVIDIFIVDLNTRRR